MGLSFFYLILTVDQPSVAPLLGLGRADEYLGSVLHYTCSELVWQCRQGTRCFCREVMQELVIYTSERTTGTFVDNGSISLTYALDSWRASIANYSRRDLTVENDILPAFSALAKAYWPLGKYLTGLCKRDLLIGLLWSPYYIDISRDWDQSFQSLSHEGC